MPQVQEQKQSQANTARAADNAAAMPRTNLSGLDYDAQMAALSPNASAATAGATAKSAPIAPPPPTAAAEKKDEGLPAAKASAAVSFNSAKGLKPAVWAQIAGVVGSSSTTLDTALVQAVAAWQKGKGLGADGRVGDITMSWLSREAGGEGLDAHVKSNNVLFVGINPKSKNVEHGQIQSQTGSTGVTGVKGHKTQDAIDADGKQLDLSTPEGLTQFVSSLKGGLDEGRRAKLEEFINSSGGRTKDEMAEFARQLHRAETGATIFTRVCLSGHSNGDWWWGDDNDGLRFEQMAVLHEIFPIATGQVRSLMLSACNTGQMGKLAQYRSIFPNVNDIWAYVGYSPDAQGGSLKHIGSWEKATRFGSTPDKVHEARKQVAKGSGKNDKHVAVATYDEQGNETSYATESEEAADDFETLKATVDAQRPIYDKAFDQGVIDKTALNAFYTKLQNLIGNFGGQLDDLEMYQKMLERTLPLRHWDNVTKNFTQAHGATVKAGYEAAKKPVVSYQGMTRDKALGAIAAYPKPGDEAHNLLSEKLKNLDNIPVSWN